jgi:hypothetical protein
MRAALADPDLFGSILVGPSWEAWRVWLIALVGEGLTDEERVTFSLSPEDFARLEKMLSGEADESGKREWERNEKYADQDQQGEDEPPAFRGRPESGGRTRWHENGRAETLPTKGPNIPPEWHKEFPAQDARRDSYLDMFPANAKVGVSW